MPERTQSHTVRVNINRVGLSIAFLRELNIDKRLFIIKSGLKLAKMVFGLYIFLILGNIYGRKSFREKKIEKSLITFLLLFNDLKYGKNSLFCYSHAIFTILFYESQVKELRKSFTKE